MRNSPARFFIRRKIRDGSVTVTPAEFSSSRRKTRACRERKNPAPRGKTQSWIVLLGRAISHRHFFLHKKELVVIPVEPVAPVPTSVLVVMEYIAIACTLCRVKERAGLFACPGIDASSRGWATLAGLPATLPAPCRLRLPQRHSYHRHEGTARPGRYGVRLVPLCSAAQSPATIRNAGAEKRGPESFSIVADSTSLRRVNHRQIVQGKGESHHRAGSGPDAAAFQPGPGSLRGRGRIRSNRQRFSGLKVSRPQPETDSRKEAS